MYEIIDKGVIHYSAWKVYIARGLPYIWVQTNRDVLEGYHPYITTCFEGKHFNFLIMIDMKYSLLTLDYRFPVPSAQRYLEYTKHYGSSLLPSSVVWLTRLT